MQSTLSDLRRSLREACDAHGRLLYDEREARAVADLVMAEVCGLSPADRILHPDLPLPSDQRQRVLHVARQLAEGVPVQQALGYAWFCGERFVVTPDVLVPRPETAELVQWVVSVATSFGSSEAPLRILDVGTGSGCIALSLARLIHHSDVFALDLSTAALSVADQNAKQQHISNVHFVHSDILRLSGEQQSTGLSTGCSPSSTIYPQASDVALPTFHVIVSNPPYVCQREAVEMSSLVLDHEPSMALFVPDADPLLFYRAIARYALSHLVSGGYLFFEVNAAYGPDTCQLLEQLGFASVTLRQDVTGRDRMVSAQLLRSS